MRHVRGGEGAVLRSHRKVRTVILLAVVGPLAIAAHLGLAVVGLAASGWVSWVVSIVMAVVMAVVMLKVGLVVRGRYRSRQPKTAKPSDVNVER
jgi:sulfite exporter TauE/SafE